MGVALLVYTGHWRVAVALVVVLFAVTQAVLVSPRFRRSLQSGLARTAHAIGHGVGLALSWTLLTFVFVVVIVPVSVVALVVRHPLGRPRGLAGAGWVPRETLSPAPGSSRMYGPEPARAPALNDASMAPTPAPDDPPGDAVPLVDEAPVDEPPAAPRPRLRRRAPRLVTVLGIITALVLVDLAIGAGMTATGFVPHDRGDTRRDIEHAVGTTMAAPGIAGEPWAGEYRDSLIEYELGGSTYEPYLVREPRAYSSRYLNTTAAERLSYTPRTSAGTDPVRIAFFGGSVMFGVGQRDEHTIPSALARLAEDAGVPVEVHNYGLPGWVAWQEIQYFERLLAAGEQYDLVVFYDGFNEFLVQHTGFSEDPTHVGSATLEQLAVEYNDLHKTEPDTFDGLAEVGAAYRRASGVARLYDRFRGEDPRGEGELQAPATPEQQADAALDVYERARRVATDLATGHGTSIHFFWQPTKAGWEPSVIDRLPDDVTDVSHVLDGREDDVYIDEVHTNEAGATLVAEALWADLAPEVERAAGGRAP